MKSNFKCPQCGAVVFDAEDKEVYYCPDCGMVMSREENLNKPITKEWMEKQGWEKGYTNIDADYYLDTDKFIINVNLNPSCDKHGGISCFNKEKEILVMKECSSHSMLKFNANWGKITLADIYDICKLCDIDFKEK